MPRWLAIFAPSNQIAQESWPVLIYAGNFWAWNLSGGLISNPELRSWEGDSPQIIQTSWLGLKRQRSPDLQATHVHSSYLIGKYLRVGYWLHPITMLGMVRVCSGSQHPFENSVFQNCFFVSIVATLFPKLLSLHIHTAHGDLSPKQS